MGLAILKGYTSKYAKSITNPFYKYACIAWAEVNINFSPPSPRSIENLWIYENIILKDDDGRVYKPPANSSITVNFQKNSNRFL